MSVSELLGFHSKNVNRLFTDAYRIVRLLMILSFPATQAQFFTAVNGRCDTQRMYNYGTCRLRTCPDNETFLPGTSYCDVYRRSLGTPVVRCATSLPKDFCPAPIQSSLSKTTNEDYQPWWSCWIACCVWGGECRQSCNTNERQLRFPSDCGPAERGVCCVNSSQTRIAPPPTGPQPLPLPPIQTSIAQLQGVCQANPVLDTRVLGGREVSPQNWPWMVHLVFAGDQRAVCSGVLVDPDTVLTVAHCVNGARPRDIQIQVGDFDLSQREPGEELLQVSAIMPHRDFVMGSLGNDFAMLKLSRPATMGASVRPACLPDPRVPLVTGPNARCYMAGWGLDDTSRVSSTLRAAPVTVIDMNLCQATLNSVIGRNQQLPPDVICTRGLANQDSGACLFDDGGMLACADLSGQYTLTGLVSQYSCGNLPTIYTRVDAYIPSILARL